MTIKFRLIPRQNISRIGEEECWNITGLPARLELQPQQFPLPFGWVLLSGVLYRSGQDYSARLIAEVGGVDQPYHFFPLPVSRKGTILELIYLPKGVLRLVLEPMQSHGQFQLVELTIKPVGHVERIGKMVNRVVPLLFKYPYEQRHRSGLRLHTPVTNLHKAYQIAGRLRAYSASLSYQQWIEEFDLLSHRDRQLIQRRIKKWRKPPHFEIIIAADVLSESKLRQTLDSLHRQLFRHFRVTLLLQPQEKSPELSYFPPWLEIFKLDSKFDLTNLTSSKWSNTWILSMHPGVVLADHTLYWIAHEALSHKNTSFIYSDHDGINESGKRIDPVFKPDWSQELLRSTNYIGCTAAIRSDALFKAGGLSLTDVQSPDYHDLFLRVSEQLSSEAIRHIPAVLWHLQCKAAENTEPFSQSRANPVASHLKRLGISASVEKISVDHFRVTYGLPEIQPMISIVIPTRDALEHLSACVESLLNLSSYKNFEVIIVDNQSSDSLTLDYLKKLALNPQIRVLHYPHPFNYSAINNFAANEALGEVLCLLNNDTEVITPGWMEEMLGHLLQQTVGAVGAKLYFSDGRVQHAGDTVGPGGCAHHLHSMIGHNDPGYCSRAILAQDLSSVTGACLMTWRKLFLELGGLDEVNLPVSFNDVDYCLRVRDAGYRVVWTPYAELYHHESVSRGKDDTPEKIERSRGEATYMRKRWKHLMHHDPFYNPNLSYERPDFSLSNAPMIKKPW